MLEVCCALIFKDGRLLAVQRSADSAHPGQWELPGGKIEEGESSVACIIREIKEELNVRIFVEGVLHPLVHKYPDKELRLIPFVAEIWGGEFRLNEHEAARWLTADELMELDWQEADLRLLRLNKAAILRRFGNNDEQG